MQPNQTAFQGTLPFAPTEFVADTVPLPHQPMSFVDLYMTSGIPMLMRPSVPPFYYGYTNPPEPLPTPLQTVPPHIPSQNPSQLGYQMGLQPVHPQPVPQARSVPVSDTKTGGREKKILAIFNPTTLTPLNLFEAAKGVEVSDGVLPPAPVAPGESPPSKSAGDHTTERPPVHRPLIPLEELQDKIAKEDVVTKEALEDLDESQDVQEGQEDLEVPVSSMELAAADSKVARLLGETTDVESSAVSDEGEDYDVGRRIYSREFLLKCKDSPITQCPPEDFQVRIGSVILMKVAYPIDPSKPSSKSKFRF